MKDLPAWLSSPSASACNAADYDATTHPLSSLASHGSVLTFQHKPNCLLLIPQFATTDTDTKARIVQRGAVPPLIHMLSHTDVSLREMAAFALGRLAQNHDNQVRLQGGAERCSMHGKGSARVWLHSDQRWSWLKGSVMPDYVG